MNEQTHKIDAEHGSGMAALPRQVTPEMMREYQHRIAPIVRAIADIEALRPVQVVRLHPDHLVEIDRLALPPEIEAMIVQYRGMIQAIAISTFGPAAGGA